MGEGEGGRMMYRLSTGEIVGLVLMIVGAIMWGAGALVFLQFKGTWFQP